MASHGSKNHPMHAEMDGTALLRFRAKRV